MAGCRGPVRASYARAWASRPVRAGLMTGGVRPVKAPRTFEVLRPVRPFIVPTALQNPAVDTRRDAGHRSISAGLRQVSYEPVIHPLDLLAGPRQSLLAAAISPGPGEAPRPARQGGAGRGEGRLRAHGGIAEPPAADDQSAPHLRTGKGKPLAGGSIGSLPEFRSSGSRCHGSRRSCTLMAAARSAAVRDAA